MVLQLTKLFFLVKDLEINLPDFQTNKKVLSFVHLMFESSMMSTIKTPTRVTQHTATAIDNIITNCNLNTNFKSAIVQTDLSDHFPIIFINEFNKPLLRMIWKNVYTSEILMKTHSIVLNIME